MGWTPVTSSRKNAFVLDGEVGGERGESIIGPAQLGISNSLPRAFELPPSVWDDMQGIIWLSCESCASLRVASIALELQPGALEPDWPSSNPHHAHLRCFRASSKRTGAQSSSRVDLLRDGGAPADGMRDWAVG